LPTLLHCKLPQLAVDSPFGQSDEFGLYNQIWAGIFYRQRRGHWDRKKLFLWETKKSLWKREFLERFFFSRNRFMEGSVEFDRPIEERIFEVWLNNCSPMVYFEGSRLETRYVGLEEKSSEIGFLTLEEIKQKYGSLF